jgi:hypothetical protein
MEFLTEEDLQDMDYLKEEEDDGHLFLYLKQFGGSIRSSPDLRSEKSSGLQTPGSIILSGTTR